MLPVELNIGIKHLQVQNIRLTINFKGHAFTFCMTTHPTAEWSQTGLDALHMQLFLAGKSEL